MEAEVASKDQAIEELRTKLEHVSEELSKAIAKYHRTECDLSAAQVQVHSLSQEIDRFRSQKRELELLNDDWERSKR